MVSLVLYLSLPKTEALNQSVYRKRKGLLVGFLYCEFSQSNLAQAVLLWLSDGTSILAFISGTLYGRQYAANP